MELETLTVHVDQALRMAQHADIAHQRLALILLDSAAELLMHRRIRHEFDTLSVAIDLLTMAETVDRRPCSTPEQLGWAADVKTSFSRVPSAQKREKIRKYFDSKANYLVTLEFIDTNTARVLRKLHAYRNEAYHRDHIREGSISSAVKIYSHLVLNIMARYRLASMSGHEFSSPILSAFARPRDMFGSPGSIAAELRTRYHIDTDNSLCIALEAHLTDRLQNLEAIVEEVLDFTSGAPDPPTASDIWTLFQVSTEERPFAGSAADLRAISAPVRFAQLTRWQKRASRISEEEDELSAFRVFADLEDEFEKLNDRRWALATPSSERSSLSSTSGAVSSRR